MSNILFLGTYRSDLVKFLSEQGDQVICLEKKITADSELVKQANFIISYGYRYILKKDILDKFKQKIINIHIYLLPWNRGADPNLWSFLEDTPKGVTIHYIDSGIDTGNILVQQKVCFSMEETLKTTYDKLSYTAEELLKKHWLDIREKNITSFPQGKDSSFHTLKDKDKYNYLLIKGWDTPISQLIGKAL